MELLGGAEQTVHDFALGPEYIIAFLADWVQAWNGSSGDREGMIEGV
jgi:hypothetical protein